ncbi:MAG TPA: proline--tRNA ligase [candidate division Zixibacteria bacterium]|nr:proline--tRNA ligase [candidate division Zixibacteria bacterium]
MRWTQTYIPTLRDAPADAELISHELLVRGGFIRKLAAGIYLYLPLMQRVIQKFSQIVREEMNAAGAVEITMSALAPAEVWQDSGRYETAGREQMRLKDRHLRDYVLNGTHEEVITTLIRGELKSYKQLPLNMYQIQVKFRDEIRPRFGLLRGREFIMKDAYSFDKDIEGHRESYQKMVDAYFKIFERAGLQARKVESDTGAMGGEAAHEFMVIVETTAGEETLLFCDTCDYAANAEKAEYRELNPPTADTEEKALAKVDTPGAATIEEVTAFLKVDAKRLVKTLLYQTNKDPIAALVRGDRELNEVKLKNAADVDELEMADPELVAKLTNAPVGFAGPVGLDKDVPLYVDPEVERLKNFVVGANAADAHYLNCNLGRDFTATAVADLSTAAEGEGCPRCAGTLKRRKGIEVGNTFMLGTKYSKSMDATFLDENGKALPFIMGSYGIGITRTPQAAIERFHDEAGIVWPRAIAPYSVHIVPLNYKEDAIRAAADRLYEELTAAGVDTLLDDRPERAGVKLNDADLIGCPVRVAIGAKSLEEGKIEVKARSEGDSVKVELPQAAAAIREKLSVLG